MAGAHDNPDLTETGGALPPSPWILVDDVTIDAVTAVLERLTGWLEGGNPKHTGSCARALSLGETSDPETIWSWTEALAARLRRRADADAEADER